MVKNTKIWLNYIGGGLISLFLLYSIYHQVVKQAASLSPGVCLHTGPPVFLWLCIGLMFVNTSLEGYKWFLLARTVQPIAYSRAFASYLAGVAFSIITPNRIGEYPGRILYLGGGNTFRFINVSVLGVMAQLSSVYLFGMAGLIYYNIAFPAFIAKMALAGCLLANVFIIIVYWRFEAWVPAMAKIGCLRRFSIYGRLLNRVSARRQAAILGISALRFAIFTAQYLFLLRWMNVCMPLAEGFCMSALFFWVMAVIPSVALTELGVRGAVSLFLFRHFSDNLAGMAAASAGIWALNLIIPSVIGSVLIARMKWLS